jgi:transcriptional regulator with XRE-family HTH domain
MRKQNPYVGTTLDEFMAGQGMLADAEAVAVKRVLAYQLRMAMEDASVSKAEMARRMGTSRAAVERLLDPASGAVTLATLARAAAALGRQLAIALAEPPPRALRAREKVAAYAVVGRRRRSRSGRRSET